ncbi:hypothetical protein G5I_00218 [Acromyrmex echinatior]|uniref:Uncharacterized protein n=1 Tax=Acromyrmex echinatior TaxID=103372 RepID=F4W4A6_ACREC|nr:hypothetical protein G5I_00218 [Acromyrmex echinatior]
MTERLKQIKIVANNLKASSTKAVRALHNLSKRKIAETKNGYANFKVLRSLADQRSIKQNCHMRIPNSHGGKGEEDDVTGGDVTRRGGDVTGEEEENDVTVGDVAGMMRCGEIPNAGNYIARNYIAEIGWDRLPEHIRTASEMVPLVPEALLNHQTHMDGLAPLIKHCSECHREDC